MSMGQAAAVAYLRAVREGRGLSQDELADLVGVEKKQISRWETNKAEPTGPGLAGWIAALKANADQVIRLFIDEHTTPDDARRLAMQYLGQEAMGEIDRQASLLSDEEREIALRALSKLLKNV